MTFHLQFRQVEQSIRQMLLLALLYLLPSVQALLPLDDPDIWWHLRTGQWIIQHGAVPVTDPFSSYGQGKFWIAYSWLFDVVVYRIFVGFGAVGLIFFTVILALLIAMAIHAQVRRAHFSLVPEILITAAALTSIKPAMSPRPWLFSILFLVLELSILLRFRRTREPRGLYWLPLIFAAWANIHVQFAYGLAVLFLLAIEPLAQRLVTKVGGDLAAPHPVRPDRVLPFITDLCVLATLANPYHVYIYKPILEYVSQTQVFDIILELQSHAFRDIGDWVFLCLILSVLFSLGWRRETRIFHLGALALGVFLSFRARRDGWVAAVSAVAVLSDWQRAASPSRPVLGIHVPGAAAIVILGLLYFVQSRNISERAVKAEVAKQYPVNAARFIHEHNLAGPLYNQFNWGGFLIWSLPELSVSMDGRSNLHGEARIEQNRQTWWGMPGWNTDPELIEAKVIVGPIDLPLIALLRTDNRFRLCYEDRVAAVFVAATKYIAMQCSLR
jgi:hypothetical protein